VHFISLVNNVDEPEVLFLLKTVEPFGSLDDPSEALLDACFQAVNFEVTNGDAVLFNELLS